VMSLFTAGFARAFWQARFYTRVPTRHNIWKAHGLPRVAKQSQRAPVLMETRLFASDSKPPSKVSVNKLSQSEAATEITALDTEILAHNELYHVVGEPQISDAEYDKLVRRAKAVIKRFPDLSSHYTSAQIVGAEGKNSSRRQVSHAVPMLSLENAFDCDDIDSFVRKYLDIRNSSHVENGVTTDFIVEPKIDGLSLSLIYQNGALSTASTRGNGLTGEDVTDKAVYIAGIPLQLPVKDDVEVRGEVYISRQDFAAMNSARANRNETLFSTARNAAAGSLRLLDTNQTHNRKLRFFAYDLISQNQKSGIVSWCKVFTDSL
jgi:DNA ligase (NAD+)